MEASGAERQRDQQKQGDGSEEKDEARRQEDEGEGGEPDSDEEEDSGPFISLKRLNWGEFMGMLAALGLFATLHLPWFSTSAKNDNSIITSAGVGPGETATAW